MCGSRRSPFKHGLQVPMKNRRLPSWPAGHFTLWTCDSSDTLFRRQSAWTRAAWPACQCRITCKPASYAVKSCAGHVTLSYRLVRMHGEFSPPTFVPDAAPPTPTAPIRAISKSNCAARHPIVIRYGGRAVMVAAFQGSLRVSTARPPAHIALASSVAAPFNLRLPGTSQHLARLICKT